MQRTIVIDIVGLTPALVGEHTPNIQKFLSSGAQLPIDPVLPCVTTVAQSTYVTGKYPSDHGIVGNGWYSRQDAEIRFWKQSNHIVEEPKVWETARELDDTKSFTVAKNCWWYNMYSSADFSITPRPMYPADGRKIPDCYTQPPELRDQLQESLGQFPLFNFWGPTANIKSSQWIANASMWLEEQYSPTLHLVYLPHLDYCLQKIGTTADKVASDLNEIDQVVGELIEFFEQRNVSVILLSEYGISPVNNPIHINRALRKADLIQVRNEMGRELLDAGASKAFAVSDHQVAHVYVNDKQCLSQVREILEDVEGIELILDEQGKKEYHIDHDRAGDFVCMAKSNSWFTYYYWLDDEVAPDYARCVDIHRKPGYDPVELFVDPDIMFPTIKAGFRLAQKQLGFRYLMDLIPLDASLVIGSHGHMTKDPEQGALFITKQTEFVENRKSLKPIEIHDLILKHLGLL